MWNLKYDMSECETENRNRVTDRENRLVVATGEGVWGRDELGAWG